MSENSIYYVCQVGNVKTGTTKNGNPYIRLGLVIKTGPKKGQWLNYMLFVTPKTKDRVKKELELAGVTLVGDEYKLDRRFITAVWDFSKFWNEECVVAIRESKFQPEAKKIDDSLENDEF